MFGHIITAVTGSTIFFILFTMAFGFWGRMISKLLKINKDIAYGDPLTLVICISILSVILRQLYRLSHNFDLLYSLLFVLGIAGATAEIILFIFRQFKNYSNKPKLLSDLAAKHVSLIIGSLVCIVLSVYLCLIWPTRSMEPWLSSNYDYYSWNFHADYWRGIVDPSQFGIHDTTIFNIYALNPFGSFIFMGLFSSAKGTISLMTTPYFMVSILSWIAVSIYSLIRSIFKLSGIVAFLLSLALIGGNFFNFISFLGLFGHIISLLGFLSCLIVIFNKTEDQKPKERFLTIFFPILFLYVCYPSAFVVFMGLIIFASFLLEIFSNYKNNISLPSLFLKFLKQSFLLIIISIALSFLLVPLTPSLIIERIISAATQAEGYRLNLIEPAFFSGFPLYNDNLVSFSTDASYTSYLIYFLFIILLTTIACSKKNPYITIDNRAKIIASSILLMACVMVYLGYYKAKGNIYQVWKFASYSILPLSFIASSLFVTLIFRLVRGKPLAYYVGCAISCLILFTPQISAINSPFYGALGKNTEGKSISPLLLMLSKAYQYDHDKQKIILDMVPLELNLAAALLSIRTNKQIYLHEPVYFLPGSPNYFKVLDENAVILTNKIVTGLYNSFVTMPQQFTMFRYDYNDLNRLGAVAYSVMLSGFKGKSNFATTNTVHVKLLLPHLIRDKDVKFQVEAPFDKRANNYFCNNATVTYPDNSQIADAQYQNGVFEGTVPLAQQNDGYVDMAFHLPSDPSKGTESPNQGNFYTDCVFRFNGVTVTAAHSDGK
jgi:hypothetical protein